MDWAQVASILVGLNIILSLWLFRQIVFTVRSLVQDLDQNLGLAIKALVEGGLGEIEQINPIQQALAQMLIGKMENSPIEAVITERGADGKFSKPS